MKYNYNINYNEELNKIKNNSFDKFIEIYKKEISNIDIYKYLIENFENEYCKIYKIYHYFDSKDHIINSSMNEANEIMNLLKETNFSENTFNQINEEIKVKINFINKNKNNNKKNFFFFI